MFRIILALALAFQGLAFSIPGVSTGVHPVNKLIPVDANELDSIITQLNFEHYYLNYCGERQAQKKEETFGGALLGESTVSTPYSVNMTNDELCKTLCVKENGEDEVEKFKWVIDRNYHVNLVIDGLPAIYRLENQTHKVGFPVGWKNEKTNEYYIYNHLELNIHINRGLDAENPNIVLFTVVPHSVNTATATDDNDNETEVAQCTQEKNHKINFKNAEPQVLKVGGKIAYSYDVKFHNSSIAFGSRWDTYKEGSQDEKIHWFSIMNSFIINLILTVVIGYILKRTVGNDIRMYNELKTSEDIQEDRGWKQLSRDVFRPPNRPLLLSALIGTGVQVGTMFFLTLLFICLGFMKQSHRGSLLSTIILFYNFMGMFAGYYSARIYKMFNGAHWIKCTLVTAFLFPGINFLVFYAINVMLVFEESSSAIHVGTVLSLVALWFGISIPLVFLGSLVGYKKQAIVNPCKYNPIPKFIKPQPWYLNTNVLCLLGGLLPFGSVFIELVFMMMSIWGHSFYYLFAFLFAVILILLITSAEISIVITYLQLCNGNHKVWWRSFFNTGSIALYIFGYSIFYYITELNMVRFSSIFLYFGYMFTISFTFFIFCGTVGFLASYWFTRTIYSSIRID